MTIENAIKQLKRMKIDMSHTGDEYNAIMKAINVLEKYSIRRTGKWKLYKNETDVFNCTACGAVVYYYPTWDYCPYCGARMESEDEE